MSLLIFLLSDASFSMGLLIGGSFTAGCAVCVAPQYQLVRTVTGIGSPWQLARADVISYFSHGGIYCLGEFPGQLYGRLLIIIVSAALGQQMTGVYIYIRQVLRGIRTDHRLHQAGGVPPVSVRRARNDNASSEGHDDAGCEPQCIKNGPHSSYCHFPAARHSATAIFQNSLLLRIFRRCPDDLGDLYVFRAGDHLATEEKAYTAVLLVTRAFSAVITAEFTHIFGLTCIACCDIMMNAMPVALFVQTPYRT
jgi:hypothetical protein